MTHLEECLQFLRDVEPSSSFRHASVNQEQSPWQQWAVQIYLRVTDNSFWHSWQIQAGQGFKTTSEVLLQVLLYDLLSNYSFTPVITTIYVLIQASLN